MTDLPKHWQEPSIREALGLPRVSLVDLRLVHDRNDVLRVSIEGRTVIGLPASNDLSIVLAELARRIEGAAWASGRSTLVEVADPTSTLFVGSP
jgi:hypothetical protein